MTDMTTILTCDKCGLPYRASLIPHECAEWTKGRNKHKGDVMERRDNEQPFSKQVAKMMVDYDTLVEQRDRLVAALREIQDYRNTSMICIDGDNDTELESEYRKGARAAADNVAVLARRVLATVEQPSPSTTGDEQGGGEL